MRELSDNEQAWIDRFSMHDVRLEVFFPSGAGLSKGILDATENIRHFLLENRIHDYETQGHGKENKHSVPITFIGVGGKQQANIVFYRSSSRGDRRFWAPALRGGASEGDALALVSANGGLAVINISTVRPLRQGDALQAAGSGDKMNNEFLEYLLTLQQDGESAISAPSNWGDKPRLYVKTWLDEALLNSFSGLIDGQADAQVAPWHFFVGSPGNGKSAAVGNLIRTFRERGFNVVDEDGVDIRDLGGNEIPRLIKVTDPEKRTVPLRIAQDASVVKEPFSGRADPARDFIEIVDNAIQDRVALLVCANRGVLENAARIVANEAGNQPHPVWGRLVSQRPGKVELESGKASKCSSFDISFSKLDNRSLLIKSDVFEKLVDNAVSNPGWETCSECGSKSACPFFANRTWLSDEAARDKFLALLRRVEVLSGQAIVFREGTALLSFILAGCPLDYAEEKGACAWVHEKVKQGDYFSLLGRRIYMSLFSAYSPIGLEEDEKLSDNQKELLKRIAKSSNDKDLEPLLDLFDGGGDPSTSVGVERLVGRDGFMKKMDILNGPLPSGFVKEWDYQVKEAFDKHEKDGKIGAIERECLNVWQKLEDRIEDDPTESVEKYSATRRWLTSVSYRIGALIEGRTLFDEELDAFVRVLSQRDDDTQGLWEVRSVQEQLRTALAPSSGIELSEHVKLAGHWAERTLVPKISEFPSDQSLDLPVSIGNATQGKYSVRLGAEAFSWLMQMEKHGLSSKTFPHDMLMAIRDMIVRAAALSQYAYEGEDVSLAIDAGEQGTITLFRTRGQVIPQTEPR